jgi:hypothetical protein
LVVCPLRLLREVTETLNAGDAEDAEERRESNLYSQLSGTAEPPREAGIDRAYRINKSDF